MSTIDEKANVLHSEAMAKLDQLGSHPAPQPQPEPTRSERLREAGFTSRDNRIECDECGKKFTPQMLPIHKCEPTEAQHPDDAAVDRFAAAMKAKLAEKRAEGRGGWDDPEQCSTTYLATLLRGHVAKGDPLDVGNFAMMLWNRGGATNEIEPTEAQITGHDVRRAYNLCPLHLATLDRYRWIANYLNEVLRAALAAK